MKILIIIFLFASCSTTEKIPVRFNKYGPVHKMPYQVIDGKIYVKGREVFLMDNELLLFPPKNK